MKKRPNAQDLLQKSNPLFGKTTFLEAYPDVEYLDLTVKAIPRGFGDHHTYHYSLQNPPGEFCPCPNRMCTGGGFEIGRLLSDLIFNKQTHGISEGPCVGGEKAGRGSRSCYYSFKAEATIRYKSGDEK